LPGYDLPLELCRLTNDRAFDTGLANRPHDCIQTYSRR
jgi:hypothetical protein